MFITLKVGKHNICVHNGDLETIHQVSSNEKEVNAKVFFAIEFGQETGSRDTVMFTVGSAVPILALFFAQMLEINILV